MKGGQVKYLNGRKVDALIEEIHQASIEPDLLPSLLEKISNLFNLHTTGFISREHSQRASTLSDSFGIDSKYLNAYNQHFNKLDPSFDVIKRKHLRFIVNHVTERNIPKGDYKWREFACDFIQPQRHFFTAAININSELDEIQRAWIFTRTKKQGSFSQSETEALERLGFHMKNAYARLEAKRNGANKIIQQNNQIHLLTKRELEILDLIAQNTGRALLSKQLNISVHTLDEHRKHIRSKLELNRLDDEIASRILKIFNSHQ